MEALVAARFERRFELRTLQIGEIDGLSAHGIYRLSKNLLEPRSYRALKSDVWRVRM
jgi:hypothetical protein